MSNSDNIVLMDVTPRGVANITLNRPEVHNAFNGDVIRHLLDCYRTVGERADIRVAVLRGNGKSFSAGGDLAWMKRAVSYTREQNIAETMELARMLRTVNECPKPTVALLHGNCFAGATGLTSCCDIAIGVKGIQFALTEVRLGLTPATISPYVVAAIGARNARRYFLTAERFDADQAYHMGLLHQVVPDAAALATTGEKVIDDLLAGASGALAHSKQLVFRVVDRPVDDAIMRYTAENIADRRASAEGQEGLAAFFEKRKPNWVA